MSKVIWFCDSHITQDDDLQRFDTLGKLIYDQRPDKIVQGGDYATMESLSHWDKDKRLIIEGRRIMDDLNAAKEGWKIVERYIELAQEADRRSKRKVWRPELVWMVGNHEDWIRQYVERNPEFEGFIDLQDQLDFNYRLYSKFNWVEWKDMYSYDGILFTHAPIGRTGPIHSKYITARSLADMAGASIVFGHTHRNQADSIARYDGAGVLQFIRAVNLGCFFEKWPHYAEGNTNDYWQGVSVIHTLGEGKFDVEEWSLERMKRVYG